MNADVWIAITKDLTVPSSTGYIRWQEYTEDEKLEKAKDKFTKENLPEEFKDNVKAEVVELYTSMDLQFIREVNEGIFLYNDQTLVEFKDESIEVEDEYYVHINTNSIPALIRFEYELRTAMRQVWEDYVNKQKENPSLKNLFVDMNFMFFLPMKKMYGHSKIVIACEIFHIK